MGTGNPMKCSVRRGECLRQTMTDPCSCEESISLREQIETQAARFNETAGLLGAANMEVLKLRELAGISMNDERGRAFDAGFLAGQRSGFWLGTEAAAKKANEFECDGLAEDIRELKL